MKDPFDFERAALRVFEDDGKSGLKAVRPYLQKCRVRGVYSIINCRPMAFWAEQMTPPSNANEVMELRFVVVDTSERVEGICVKRQLTFYPWLRLFGAHLVAMPFDGEMMHAENLRREAEGG